MPRLLVRQRVHHGFAEFDVLVRGDGAQGLDLEPRAARLAAALYLYIDLPFDVAVEHVLEREEFRGGFAVDRHENIARRQHPVGRRSGLHVRDHQHAGQFRIGAAQPRFSVGIQAEAPEFIVGRVFEYRLQSAARHGLSRIDELQCPRYRRQGQVEAGGGARRSARIQRHHPAFDIDDRRAGRTARRAGGGLVVEGIEIVVLAVAVFGSLTIQARQGAGKNRQLLAGVIADHADFAADDRARRIQRQFGRLDEFEFRGIVAVDAEVMDGIAVHRIQLHLLAIEEDRLRGHGSRRHDMPIRQDESALGVDDEARGLRRRVPLGVEGARAVDLNGDDAAGDSLQGLCPAGGRAHDPGRRHRRRHVSGNRSGSSGGKDAGYGQQQYGQKRCNTGHADPRVRLCSMPVVGQDQEPNGS